MPPFSTLLLDLDCLDGDAELYMESVLNLGGTADDGVNLGGVDCWWDAGGVC